MTTGKTGRGGLRTAVLQGAAMLRGAAAMALSLGMTLGTPLGMTQGPGGAAAIGLGAAAWAAGAAAAADTTIGPAIQVNKEVITSYELDQRRLLLEALNQPGDIPRQARAGLIDDRIRTEAAKALEVRVTNADVQQGLAEFAARGKLDGQQLIAYLASKGVEVATMRDFVRSGLQWRGAVRKRFAGQIPVTEAEIDRAISAGLAGGREIQISLAEIFLPDGADGARPEFLAQRIIDGAFSTNAFMIYAQKYSKGPTAAAGGLLDWQLLSQLPPEVQAAVQDLQIGQVSKPLQDKDGIRIFYLRDKSPGPAEGKPAYDVEYAVLAFAPGQETGARAEAGRVTSCDQLYPVARGLPEEALRRQTAAQSALPAGYAAALARMDPGETRLLPRADGGTDLLMMCDLVPITAIPASRSAVRQMLVNRKMALLADGWLNELRSDAFIKDF